MTFTVTAIILGLSFLAVYGLSIAQRDNANNRFLSILISLVISLINIIITRIFYILFQNQSDTSASMKEITQQLSIKLLWHLSPF